MKTKIDYSLYLVTDSSKSILGNRRLEDVVSQAIDGGEFLRLILFKHLILPA